MIVGLTSGIVAEWGKRVGKGLAPICSFQPPNSSLVVAISSAVMAESLGDQIAKLPDVDESAPTLILSDPRTLINVFGIDYKRFNAALSQGFIFFAPDVPSRIPTKPIADDIIAQTRHIKVGDTVTLVKSPLLHHFRHRRPRQRRALLYSP